MNPLALALAGLLSAAPARAGQIDAPAAGEFSPGAQTGSIGSSLKAPIPLQLTVPTLSGALSALRAESPPALRAEGPPPLRAEGFPVIAAAKALPVTARALDPAPNPALNALAAGIKSAPSAGETDFASGYGDGRARFDLDARRAGGEALVSGGTWSRVKSALLLKPLPGAEKKAPPVARGFHERLSDAAELGLLAGAWQILAAILYAVAGAHAAFPALAGALWALGGEEFIKHLGSLRSVVVGGWQSSHDQKMRIDHGTGKLRDIRGRKYGEDRYDVTLPGPVTATERNVVDAASVLSGLPWVAHAGASPTVLYLLSAAAVIYLRRLWRRSRPRPAATAEDAVFERDR